MTVPLFSYLTATAELTARAALAAVALGCAALLWAGRPGAAAVLAGLTHAATSTLAIINDPAPRIDVWYMLQQASDVLGDGGNIYTASWVGSPGVQDAFSYLPYSAVLLAPGRWVAGDVRWAMLVWTLAGLSGLWTLASRRGPSARWAAGAAIALLVCVPGGLTQIDQVWTEPLLFALLVWWVVLVDRGHAWWAVLPLALACASKQHLPPLLLVCMLWRPFGFRRAVSTGVLAVALMLPFALPSVGDFASDTLGFISGGAPLRFANTLVLLALNTFGVTVPGWIPTAATLALTVGVAALVWHRQPGLGEVVRWLALVLLLLTLVNRHGFYNQYWLAGALVALSLVADRGALGGPSVAVGDHERGASADRGPDPLTVPGRTRAG